MPLSELILEYPMKFESNHNNLNARKLIWKCLQNGDHVVSAAMCIIISLYHMYNRPIVGDISWDLVGHFILNDIVSLAKAWW